MIYKIPKVNDKSIISHATAHYKKTWKWNWIVLDSFDEQILAFKMPPKNYFLNAKSLDVFSKKATFTIPKLLAF